LNPISLMVAASLVAASGQAAALASEQPARRGQEATRVPASAPAHAPTIPETIRADTSLPALSDHMDFPTPSAPSRWA
jgi:hypothetical protein